MSKKTILLVMISGLIIGSFITVFFFLKPKNGKSIISELSSPSESKTEEMVLYSDPSGFSFSYPKNIEISDDTPEDDDSYYSLLTFYNGSEKGTLAIEDTAAKTVDEYLEDRGLEDSYTLTGAVTLAGLSAKSYQDDTKIITLAVDQGIVYILEVPADSSVWEEFQNQLATTFAFAGQANASAKKSSSGGGEVVYESEEIIE